MEPLQQNLLTKNQLRNECFAIAREIWQKEYRQIRKDKYYIRSQTWMRGHIGKSIYKAEIEELLLLERLLLEKLKYGRCSYHIGRETIVQRRRHLLGGSSRYQKLRKDILTERGLVCEQCKRPVTVQEATIDHIKPVFLGGLTEKVNLRILCDTPCHRDKNRRENRIAREKGKKYAQAILTSFNLQQ